MKKHSIVLSFILPALILAVWWLVSLYSDVPRAILPSPANVAAAFSDAMRSGLLITDLLISLKRVLQAYVVAAILGLTAGSVMGVSRFAERIISPTLTAIRQIPVIAWIPLLILWFGIGEASKTAVIFIAAFFPITVNAQSGVGSTPETYLEVARLYRLTPLQAFVRIRLPWALPQILTGMKLGLSSSWMAVVAAELIAASSGIGYRLNYARGLMESDLVILCMLVIGLVGFILDLVLSRLLGRAKSFQYNK